MGNMKNKLTLKEKRWIADYPYVIERGEQSKICKEEVGGKDVSYLQSSSGDYEKKGDLTNCKTTKEKDEEEKSRAFVHFELLEMKKKSYSNK